MSDARLAEELGRMTLFSNLPPAAHAKLAEGARRVSPADGAPLFAQGDAPDAVYAVLDGRGRVRVGAPDSAAKRLMVEVFRTGDIFGEIGVLDGSPRSADALVQGEVKLARIPAAVFLETAETEPALGLALARMLSGRLRRTFGLLQDATFAPLEVRLARQVVYLLKTDSVKTDRGVRLAARFRQGDLADLLGATTRSIISILNAWRSSNLVAYDTEKAFLFVLDEPGLVAVAAGPRDGT
ncbi:Crp/Fnr family transcriptional regulator [Roseomonas terrae]|jgi:CRP/FNR family cyclic AMP-dependent transcriptional regulator|uniref:Crp/Fnr family transcriptional regulator n=1 Tax=Neoroseomonas terrae TaxID=424799 RepID=A0ABS5ENF1_9PROT|nr:Crp/Fnr family transcriptional regulator [Neoroseomonas terrae]MBR0652556.1 Crp/Fnr family transcriptional regulator [Neoroseomonas terrae]